MSLANPKVPKYCQICGEKLFNRARHAKYCKECAYVMANYVRNHRELTPEQKERYNARRRERYKEYWESQGYKVRKVRKSVGKTDNGN